MNKDYESISFIFVTKAQQMLYKGHLLSEDAVKMLLRCHSDWHHLAGDRLRKRLTDMGAFILLSGSVKVTCTLSPKGIRVDGHLGNLSLLPPCITDITGAYDKRDYDYWKGRQEVYLRDKFILFR